jgi:hypothetical protein
MQLKLASGRFHRITMIRARRFRRALCSLIIASSLAAALGTNAVAPAPADAGDYPLTGSHALLTPQFAAIALTHFACCAAHSGPIFQMVSYLAFCGVPALLAVSAFGLAGLSGLVGRIALGLIADPHQRQACGAPRSGKLANMETAPNVVPMMRGPKLSRTSTA